MEVIPKELIRIIISYTSDASLLKLLDVFPQLISDDYLFQQLFQQNFTGLYEDIFNLENKNWKERYLEIIIDIPHIKYTVRDEKNRYNVTRIFNERKLHRRHIRDKYILYLVDTIKIPEFVYQALFKKHFPKEHGDLLRIDKLLIKQIKYSDIYTIFRVSYSRQDINDDNWSDEKWIRIKDLINLDITILKIIFANQAVKDTLKQDIIESFEGLENLIASNNNDSFKFFFELYELRNIENWREFFLNKAISMNNVELIRFLK